MASNIQENEVAEAMLSGFVCGRQTEVHQVKEAFGSDNMVKPEPEPEESDAVYLFTTSPLQLQ